MAGIVTALKKGVFIAWWGCCWEIKQSERERETEREMGECTIIDIYWQK